MISWIITDIQDFISQGGQIIWYILLTLFALLFLITDRLYFLLFNFHTIEKQATQLWDSLQDAHQWIIRHRRQAFLSEQQQQFCKYNNYIRMLICICPLLGLLGTVTGMIAVFDVLNQTGTGNVKLMAAGIAKATIATLAGMFVAIIGILLQSKLNYLIKKRQHQLALLLPFSN